MDGATRRTILWLRPDQATLARDLAARAGLGVVAFAAPPEARSTSAMQRLGDAFPDAAPIADLRHALTTETIDLALFLTPDPPEPGADPDASPTDDAEILRYCRASDVTVATIEPAPASVLDAVRLEEANLLSPLRIIPLLAHTPGFADATDVMQACGPVRTVAFAARAPKRAGSLGARLFDAMHLVHALLGMPESIDATYVPHRSLPAPQRPAHSAPQSLRRLHGDLTANLRYPPGSAAATLALSSRGGHPFRGLTLLGDEGCIRFDESGFERYDMEGGLADASEPRRLEGEPDVDAIAAALIRLLDRHIPDPPPIDLAPVLAMCEAATLSAHTAQAEPPAAILRMARAG